MNFFFKKKQNFFSQVFILLVKYLKFLFCHWKSVFSAAKQKIETKTKDESQKTYIVERGIRGGKCECGTTEIGFTGNSVKSSCLIRFFRGKATEASVTVFRVAPTERGRFGGKSMFSLCSINSDGGVCSQVPATATSKSFQVRRIPAISDCTGRERERERF